MGGATNQYLTFKLDRERFAIEILKVREVLDYTEPTRIPRSPELLVGIINLRGAMVPVVDMRVVLGLTKGDITAESCIIIVEMGGEDGEPMLVGALADSVQRVEEIPSEIMKPPPRLGDKLNHDFLVAIGKVGDAFVMILNVDDVLTGEELDMVGEFTSIAAQAFTSPPEAPLDSDSIEPLVE